MTSSQAMGTFLRIWRSEWAGLSRAQLAVAVSSSIASGKTVTPRIVRLWEDGQPPDSTEELEALLRVMGRRGLTTAEVTDFREAVFAACVDRQFPGVLHEGGFAERPDVDGAAEGIFYAYAGGVSPVGGIVRLVTSLLPLEQLVLDRPRSAAPGTQERRQEAAFAMLQYCLADRHAQAGRFARARAAFAANSSFLIERLGGRLSMWVSAPRSRVQALAASAYLTRTEAVLPEIIRVYEWAERRGDGFLASISSCLALELANGLLDVPWVRVRLGSVTDRHAEVLEAIANAEWRNNYYLAVGTGAIRDGRFGDAEANLAYFDHWKDADDYSRIRWRAFVGHLAASRGNPREAIEHWSAVVETERRRGIGYSCRDFENLIREAEATMGCSRVPKRR